jgi:hypothetical protein
MAIAFVQAANQQPLVQNQTTRACAFASNNTAGNLIVVTGAYYTNFGGGVSATMSVSDTQGNTYATATSRAAGASNDVIQMFYAANCKAGANTVTVTYSVAVDYPIVDIAEYSGCATTSPLDAGFSAVVSAGSTSISAGPLTVAASGALVCWGTEGAGHVTAVTSPWNARFTPSSSTNTMWGDQLNVSTGNYNAQFTIDSTSDTPAVAMASFKPPGGVVQRLTLLGCGA